MLFATQYCYSTVTKIHMWMAEISVDSIQVVYYHADSCAISPSAFLLIEFLKRLACNIPHLLGHYGRLIMDSSLGNSTSMRNRCRFQAIQIT